MSPLPLSTSKPEFNTGVVEPVTLELRVIILSFINTCSLLIVVAEPIMLTSPLTNTLPSTVKPLKLSIVVPTLVPLFKAIFN